MKNSKKNTGPNKNTESYATLGNVLLETKPQRCFYFRPIIIEHPSGYIKNHTEIGPDISLHWESDHDVFLKTDRKDAFIISSTESFGSHLSFSINFSAYDISQIEPEDIKNTFLSFGVKRIILQDGAQEDSAYYGNLNINFAKTTLQRSRIGQFFDGYNQVSFDFSEFDNVVWDRVLSGWVDFIFSEPEFRHIELYHPAIWFQRKAFLI